MIGAVIFNTVPAVTEEHNAYWW